MDKIWAPWLVGMLVTLIVKLVYTYHPWENQPQDIKNMHTILGAFLGFILALEINKSTGYFFEVAAELCLHSLSLFLFTLTHTCARRAVLPWASKSTHLSLIYLD